MLQKKWCLFIACLSSLTIAFPSFSATELIYSMERDAGGLTSNIIAADNGNLLYGFSDKLLFEIDTKTNQLTRLLDAPHDDANHMYYFFKNQLTLSNDGRYLYGTLNSFHTARLFRYDLAEHKVQYLHEFDSNKDFKGGYDLKGPVIVSKDGKTIYGVTESGGKVTARYRGGVIYQLKLDENDSAQYHVIHAFSGKSDGRTPNGALALSPDGKFLYGATDKARKPNACGTLFSVSLSDSEKSVFKTLKHFDCEMNKPRLEFMAISADGNTLYANTSIMGRYPSLTKIDLSKPPYALTVMHKFYNDAFGLTAGDIKLSPDGKSLYGIVRDWIFKVTLDNETYTIIDSAPKYPLYLTPLESEVLFSSEFGGIYGSGAVYSIYTQ